MIFLFTCRQIEVAPEHDGDDWCVLLDPSPSTVLTVKAVSRTDPHALWLDSSTSTLSVSEDSWYVLKATSAFLFVAQVLITSSAIFVQLD